MKYNMSSSKCFFLSLCIIFTLGLLSNLQAKNLNVNQLIESLQQTIYKNKEKQLRLEHQLEAAEVRLGNLTKDIMQINQLLATETQTLDSLSIQQTNAFAKLKEQNVLLSQQIHTAYLFGGIQQWKVILNQQDLNVINRHFTYYRYLSQSRLKTISNMKQTLSVLTNTIEARHKHQLLLKKLLQAKHRQQEQQQSFLIVRQHLIEQLKLQTKNKQAQIATLVANQRGLLATLSRLKANGSIFNRNSFGDLQGKLNWPVKGHIRAHFGSLLETGQKLTGIVIGTRPGAPVQAIYGGKVIFANWLRGFGLLVIIDHGNNYMSLYARNQAIYPKVGDFIHKGEIIALTGNSGGFDKPSLYFEIRKEGTPQNPTAWCKYQSLANTAVIG